MKKYQTHIILTIIFCMMAFAAHARRMSPRDAFSDSVMCLVFKYAQTVDPAVMPILNFKSKQTSVMLPSCLCQQCMLLHMVVVEDLSVSIITK